MVLAASVMTHATIALLLLRIPNHSAHARRAYEIDVQIAAPGEGIAGAAGVDGERPSAHRRQPLQFGGPRSTQNIDDFDRGQGGDAAGAQNAVRLASQADSITLQDAPMNAVRVSQAQRIRTADDRATTETRRATPHPSDTAFLASGDGEHPERRRVAQVDPREGAPNAAPAALAGSIALRRDQTALATTEQNGGMIIFEAPAEVVHASDRASTHSLSNGAERTGSDTRIGDARSSMGRGIQNGRAERESDAARVARGRPPVDEGAAATETQWRADNVRDDQDAELLAARMLQSMVDSSERSGARAGEGRGGVGGGGAAGSGGGLEEGGRANAHIPGSGSAGALNTGESRYRRWMLELRGRVTNALAFPRARQVAMDEGQSVFHLFVRRDGTLAQAPRLVRSSGFDDLDAAALSAIERSAPFPPVPTDVAVGTDVLRIPVPVSFSNPMVR
ncbi:MAG: TonB C-terminal domain-containing protein [Sandaracinaceae bacterium]|nr:TonB C-terminal domain-containing protein [Sandaracinaceae bacterium]